MAMSPKAESVSADGELDGFQPQPGWSAEVIPGGFTRLEVSTTSEELQGVHRALVQQLDPPLRVLYVQLTDRLAGVQLDPPRRFVALDVAFDRLDSALQEFAALIYHDGRHQLWVQGRGEDKVVLEETGVMYVYPDDPTFREALERCGMSEGKVETMADRDYVRVNFSAAGDAMEGQFRHAIGAVAFD